MLSIIIPSYKDPYLQKTIDSLLENAEGDIEIVVTMDGYWQELKPDNRVRIVHLGKNRGMRGAINAAVAIAKGEYLMRMDEHQIVGKGYDTIFNNHMSFEWLTRQQSMKLIRMAMVGRNSSIPLFDILRLLGKEEILERIDGAKAQVEKGKS